MATIEIDSHSGFCFGVTRAINKAEEELAKGGHLYCLGDIVHNASEVERLGDKGLVTITHEQLKQLHNVKVLLRAHGEPPSTYEIARRNNIEIIDATCPVVLKLQQRINNTYHSGSETSPQVVIYGKRGHAEVNGLVGQTDGRALVIENEDEIIDDDENELINENENPLEKYIKIIKNYKKSVLKFDESTIQHFMSESKKIINQKKKIKKQKEKLKLKLENIEKEEDFAIIKLRDNYIKEKQGKKFNICIHRDLKTISLIILSVFHFLFMLEIHGILFALFREIKRTIYFMCTNEYSKNDTKTFFEYLSSSSINDSSKINFNYITSFLSDLFIAKISIKSVYTFSLISSSIIICIFLIFDFLSIEQLKSKENYSKTELTIFIIVYIIIYIIASLVS